MLSQEYVVRALEAHGIAWEARDGALWAVGILVYADGRAEDEAVPTSSLSALRAWLGY